MGAGGGALSGAGGGAVGGDGGWRPHLLDSRSLTVGAIVWSDVVVKTKE